MGRCPVLGELGGRGMAAHVPVTASVPVPVTAPRGAEGQQWAAEPRSGCGGRAGAALLHGRLPNCRPAFLFIIFFVCFQPRNSQCRSLPALSRCDSELPCRVGWWKGGPSCRCFGLRQQWWFSFEAVGVTLVLCSCNRLRSVAPACCACASVKTATLAV